MLVDRPVVEIFVNRGRAAFTASDGGFLPSRAGAALFNRGGTVVSTSVAAYGMGCGWTKTKPVPKAAP